MSIVRFLSSALRTYARRAAPGAAVLGAILAVLLSTTGCASRCGPCAPPCGGQPCPPPLPPTPPPTPPIPCLDSHGPLLAPPAQPDKTRQLDKGGFFLWQHEAGELHPTFVGFVYASRNSGQEHWIFRGNYRPIICANQGTASDLQFVCMGEESDVWGMFWSNVRLYNGGNYANLQWVVHRKMAMAFPPPPTEPPAPPFGTEVTK